mgnify:FL=1
MVRMGVDLIGPLPLTEKHNRYICVLQDYGTKWVELFALERKTMEHVANVLLDEVFYRYGVCAKLHSDKGTEL